MKKNKLYAFLKVTNLYKEYVKNINDGNITTVYKSCNCPNIENIFKEYSDNKKALDFLLWAKTSQGRDFWDKYYTLWKRYLSYTEE